MLLASSTVITPSLPTLSIASAIISPMAGSWLAEMVPIWAISFLFLVGFAIFWISGIIAATAASMPRFMSIGFAPAVTFFIPSRKIA